MSFLSKIFDSKTFGFLFTVALVGTALLILGKIASSEWVDLVKWLGGSAALRGVVPDNLGNIIAGKKDEIAKPILGESDVDLARDVERSTR